MRLTNRFHIITQIARKSRGNQKKILFFAEGRKSRLKSSAETAPGSCFLDELFFASGAGDGDFALTSGDANQLLAFGAFVVPVFSVFDAVQELQKAAVFLIAPVRVFGQHPVKHQDHGNVGQEIKPPIPGEHPNQTQDQIQNQNGQTQLVHTVAACKCPLKPVAEFLFHSLITLVRNLYGHYMANPAKFNGWAAMFTNC